MALFRAFYREGRDPREVVEEVGLQEKARARVGTLSGGQKQRLAVACALVGDPELLFLDEPTTGLDPQSRRQVWDIVNGFKRRGRTVVLTTHYMDEAEKLCDRIAVVDHGRVIARGHAARAHPLAGRRPRGRDRGRGRGGGGARGPRSSPTCPRCARSTPRPGTSS